jgi:hypothetical protein
VVHAHHDARGSGYLRKIKTTNFAAAVLDRPLRGDPGADSDYPPSPSRLRNMAKASEIR